MMITASHLSPGSARASRADSGASPESSVVKGQGDGEAPSPAREARALPGLPDGPDSIRYTKRRLPHFERPWAKYAVAFSTLQRSELQSQERDIVLASILHAHKKNQYDLYVGCVMPDHVHLLFEPQIRDQIDSDRIRFWSLTEILRGIKSTTAHRIAKLRGIRGPVWEKESFDRMIRSESDLHEEFHYICQNPWISGMAQSNEDYPWLWTPESQLSEPSNPGRARASRAASGASPDASQP
jgi:REP element-mobilizing transposase RayT